MNEVVKLVQHLTKGMRCSLTKRLPWHSVIMYSACGLLLIAIIGCAPKSRKDFPLQVVHDFATEAHSASVLFETPYLDFGYERYQMHLSQGWSRPERTSSDGHELSLVWAISRLAKVEVLIFDADTSARDLTFRCRPFVYDEDKTQTLELSINGRKIHRLELRPGFQTYTIAVPKGLFVPGRNVIQFGFAYVVPPYKFDQNSGKTQPRAAAFDYLKLGSAEVEEFPAEPRFGVENVPFNGEDLVQPAGSQITYRLPVPSDAVLEFGLDYGPMTKPGKGTMRTEIRLGRGDAAEKVLFFTDLVLSVFRFV